MISGGHITAIFHYIDIYKVKCHRPNSQWHRGSGFLPIETGLGRFVSYQVITKHKQIPINFTTRERNKEHLYFSSHLGAG